MDAAVTGEGCPQIRVSGLLGCGCGTQTPQAVVYVPNAVPAGPSTADLQPLGLPGQATHAILVSKKSGIMGSTSQTSVTLFDQGLIQVLQAAVTGLMPNHPYIL